MWARRPGPVVVRVGVPPHPQSPESTSDTRDLASAPLAFSRRRTRRCRSRNLAAQRLGSSQEVHVLPLQAQRLPDAHPGGQQQHHQEPVPRMPRSCQHLLDLLDRQRLGRRVTDPEFDRLHIDGAELIVLAAASPTRAAAHKLLAGTRSNFSNRAPSRPP